jgi:hypothetical protein
MQEETFAFRGLGRFIAIGVAASLAQAIGGFATLGSVARRRRATSWLSGLWLSATGLLGVAAFLSCRDARVRLTEEGVEVRLGWLWRHSIAYTSIAAAVPMTRSLMDGFGIRTDFRGTVALVLWGTEVVALDLAPPHDLPVFLFVRQRDARRLQLGLEEPERFVSAVMQRVLATAQVSG